MSKRTIIYVGGFQLPDKNAAAHRVVQNAKILRALGYRVVFVHKTLGDESSPMRKTSYNGFECWEIYYKQGKLQTFKTLYDVKLFQKVFQQYTDLFAVIAYNFPAIAMLRLGKFCKRVDAKMIADVTEWYGTKGKDLLYKVIKGADSAIRMRFVHPKLDGVVVISQFLENYYKQKTRTIRIPPLIDCEDSKWADVSRETSNVTRFVYAGSPSSEKERLDILVSAIVKLSQRYQLELNILGITEQEFQMIYQVNQSFIKSAKAGSICFHGKVAHLDALRFVKEANYACIIREISRLTSAGFPTKFVESITCGTPVIATDNSDLGDYVGNGKNGHLVTIEKFETDLEQIINSKKKVVVDKGLFDYRHYEKSVHAFIQSLSNK